MKPFPAFSLSILSIGLVLSASTGRSDDTPAAPPPPDAPANPQTTPGDGAQPAPPHRKHMGRGYVLADLTEKLGLTADQQKSIGAVIDNGRTQGKALREDDSLSKDDKRSKMMEIAKSTHDQIRAALTPDQQKLFDAMPGPGNKAKSTENN